MIWRGEINSGERPRRPKYRHPNQTVDDVNHRESVGKAMGGMATNSGGRWTVRLAVLAIKNKKQNRKEQSHERESGNKENKFKIQAVLLLSWEIRKRKSPRKEEVPFFISFKKERKRSSSGNLRLSTAFPQDLNSLLLPLILVHPERVLVLHDAS